MGKIWDLMTDKILAEKGANFSLLSLICLLLEYQPAAKNIAAFSEPSFDIQRSFILHYFYCTLPVCCHIQYILPSLLRSVKYTTVAFDIFQTYCCVHPYRKHFNKCTLLVYSS